LEKLSTDSEKRHSNGEKVKQINTEYSHYFFPTKQKKKEKKKKTPKHKPKKKKETVSVIQCGHKENQRGKKERLKQWGYCFERRFEDKNKRDITQ